MNKEETDVDDNWIKLSIKISPTGNDYVIIGGDHSTGDGDPFYFGDKYLKEWIKAYKKSLTPWWKRDKWGL